MSIDILMATYNSANYLEAQLQSIFQQDYNDWKLIIRDDNSTDKTDEIIKEFIKKMPEKIKFIKNFKNEGAKSNFNNLLKEATADYIMFADHDDIWFSDKISKSIEKMKKNEKSLGKSTPILIFTDKSITDRDLNIKYASCSRAENFNTNEITLNRLLVQNIASGCTMIINRALLDIAKNIPEAAIMHDYWLMLAASAFGLIEYIDEPTMLYRQHSQNEIGAKAYDIKYIFKKIFRKNRKNINHNIDQAAAFLKTYENKLNEKNKKMLEDFVKLKNANPLEYRLIIMRNKFYKSGLIKNIALLMRLKS